MEILLPVLRADIKLCETYIYQEEPPLNIDMTAFGGREDDVSEEDLSGWSHQTQAVFELDMFPGGHFFLHDHRAALLKNISTRLGKLALTPQRGSRSMNVARVNGS